MLRLVLLVPDSCLLVMKRSEDNEIFIYVVPGILFVYQFDYTDKSTNKQKMYKNVSLRYN